MGWLALKWFGVPRWIFALVALAALVGGAVLFHSRAVHNLSSESYKRGEDDQKARDKAMIVKLNAELAAATSKLKDKTDVEMRTVYVAAERERVLGPGKAGLWCPDPAGPAGGRDAPAAERDDGGYRLPSPDRAAVPWGWLVSRAQQCDLDRAEVIAWRTWHREVAKGFAAAAAN